MVRLAASTRLLVDRGEIAMTNLWKRRVEIGDAVLYEGDCLQLMPLPGSVHHLFSDPPYEASLHASKNSLRRPVRADSGPDLKGLNFEPIDAIRSDVVSASAECVDGWCGYFCTVEGVAKWADTINPSPIKYKRACVWVKPDSTPQLNGQGPAQGAEMLVVGWNGKGHAKWNAGGKRGVYTHCVNGKHRHGAHPTEKPASLMREILADFTNAGETILDPFMGSGTTGVACPSLGPLWVNVTHVVGNGTTHTMRYRPAVWETPIGERCTWLKEIRLSRELINIWLADKAHVLGEVAA